MRFRVTTNGWCSIQGITMLIVLPLVVGVAAFAQEEAPGEAPPETAPIELPAQSFGEAFQGVWNFTLSESEGLTVGRVLVALFIFACGIVLSYQFTRSLRRRLLTRMKLDETIAVVIEKCVFYFLLIVALFFALDTVHIPLTVFTLLGGALAIGVGFGAQNLIGNFLSGLILYMERPIKIGDFVEFEGEFGRVDYIGARCSRLRMLSGADLLVPNSFFLEKSIVNWTHVDSTVRFSVSVGVAYGSPTREVSQLLLRAVEDHGQVLKSPEPFVLFTDFGDNALVFELCFWVEMQKISDSRIVRSDVRFRIDKLFREAGIVIAYPQRDIHLDATKPLDVRVVPEGPPSTED